MSKYLEYAIIVFMAGLLLILYRWTSEDDIKFYNTGQGKAFLIDNRSGEVWYLAGSNIRPILHKSDRIPKVTEETGIESIINKEFGKIPIKTTKPDTFKLK